MDRRTVLGGIVATAAAVALPELATAKAKSRWTIMPDIRFVESSIKTVRENTITYRHRHMMRWDFKTGEMQFAMSDSERYRSWLPEDDTMERYGHLPHIGFGGAVVANKTGDPQFYPRWRAYASKLT